MIRKYLEKLWYRPPCQSQSFWDYFIICFLLFFSFIYKIIFILKKFLNIQKTKIYQHPSHFNQDKNQDKNKNYAPSDPHSSFSLHSGIYRSNIPLIVIGNITLGGTGKTPLIIYLVNLLRAQGFNPGVISRGYLGEFSKQKIPHIVLKNHTARQIGDEPLMIFSRFSNQDFNLPMAVGANRPAARDCLIKNFTEVNIILSDDGLSNYALPRDLEIIVIDGERKFGNGFLLPAGPLRENISRLKKADFIITQYGVNSDLDSDFISSFPLRKDREGAEKLFSMTLQSQSFKPVFSSAISPNPSPAKVGEGRLIHAVAGISNPSRFFKLLESMGFELIKHVFPDHYDFTVQDLMFKNYPENTSHISPIPIISTEKDMVKISCLKQELLDLEQDLNLYFYLEVDAVIKNIKNNNFNFDQEFIKKIKNRL